MRALALVAVFGSVAHADVPRATPAAIEVDREAPPPGRTEHGFDSGAPVDAWGATIAFGWLDRPIVLRTPTDESEPVRRRETVALGGAVALGDAVALDARLPLAHQIGSRLAITGDLRPLDRWVTGDLRVAGRIRLVGASTGSAFIRAELSLPSGNDRELSGDASWTLAWTLIARLALPEGISLALNAGIRLRGAEVLIADRLIGDELHGAAGIAFPIPPIHPLWCVADQVKLTAEVAGVLGDNVAGLRGPSPVEARVGLVTRPLPELTFGARVGTAIGDQIGAPAWRATLELTYQGTARLIPHTTHEEAAPDDQDE